MSRPSSLCCRDVPAGDDRDPRAGGIERRPAARAEGAPAVGSRQRAGLPRRHRSRRRRRPRRSVRTAPGPRGPRARGPAVRPGRCRRAANTPAAHGSSRRRTADPSAVATPAIVERFTASGSIGDSIVADEASAGRYRTMLVAVWSEVTDRRSPGSGAAVCTGGGVEPVVQEAASTPSRQASFAIARGGGMAPNDGTVPAELGVQGLPGQPSNVPEAARIHNRLVFTVDERDRVRHLVLEMASDDPRVVAGAVLGSPRARRGRPWSDLDLMFGVDDEVAVTEVLEEWSGAIVRDLAGVHISTFPADRSSIGSSCSRAVWSSTSRSCRLRSSARAGPSSGCSSARPSTCQTNHRPPRTSSSGTPSTTPCMHGSRSSEVGIGRPSTGSVRSATARSSSRVAGEDSTAGTGREIFHRLPPAVLVPVNDALVRSLDPEELRRALASAVAALLRESAEAGSMAEQLEDELRELASG